MGLFNLFCINGAIRVTSSFGELVKLMMKSVDNKTNTEVLNQAPNDEVNGDKEKIIENGEN